jgi:hypothetical protein
VRTSFSNLQDCNFELRITPQPIENPSTSLPGLLQGLKTRHCSVLALMSRCSVAVLDYQPSYNDFFNRLTSSAKFVNKGNKARAEAVLYPCPVAY